jgi:hypothetical protein
MAETDYQDAASGRENPLEKHTKLEEQDPYPSKLKDHDIEEIRKKFEDTGLNTENYIPDAMDSKNE